MPVRLFKRAAASYLRLESLGLQIAKDSVLSMFSMPVMGLCFSIPSYNLLCTPESLFDTEKGLVQGRL